MGTRGAFGFRIGGVDKITYNHFDSYPEGLGEKVVADLVDAVRHDEMSEVRTKAAALRLVDEKQSATPEDVAHCVAAGVCNTGVGKQSTADWYCLLRNAQPSQAGMWPLLDVGVMIDSAAFLNDSLFCEYAYIVNLDEMTFEVYRGFQREPHELGRYAAGASRESGIGSRYYPVALAGSFPLSEIPEWRSTWAATCFPPDGDEE